MAKRSVPPRRPLLEALVASLHDDAPTQEVRVGRFWTAVLGRRCGLAATPGWEDASRTLPEVPVSQHRGHSAAALARLSLSPDSFQAAVGVAAINSLLTVDVAACVDRNAVGLLAAHGRGRRVAVVGHFPFVPQLRQAVGELAVLELHPRPGDWPANEAARIIPQADVVAITGSAIVNHTIDGLLALCRRESLVVVLGPTTPLSPILFDYGIDVAAGTLVEDAQAVLRHVSAGVSFRQMAGVRLLTLLRDPSLARSD